MEPIPIDQARQILTDVEARELMIAHQIEMSIDDNRSAVQYMAELLLYVSAVSENQDKPSGNSRAHTSGDFPKDHVPYFA